MIGVSRVLFTIYEVDSIYCTAQHALNSAVQCLMCTEQNSGVRFSVDSSQSAVCCAVCCYHARFYHCMDVLPQLEPGLPADGGGVV